MRHLRRGHLDGRRLPRVRRGGASEDEVRLRKHPRGIPQRRVRAARSGQQARRLRAARAETVRPRRVPTQGDVLFAALAGYAVCVFVLHRASHGVQRDAHLGVMVPRRDHHLGLGQQLLDGDARVEVLAAADLCLPLGEHDPRRGSIRHRHRFEVAHHRPARTGSVPVGPQLVLPPVEDLRVPVQRHAALAAAHRRQRVSPVFLQHHGKQDRPPRVPLPHRRGSPDGGTGPGGHRGRRVRQLHAHHLPHQHPRVVRIEPHRDQERRHTEHRVAHHGRRGHRRGCRALGAHDGDGGRRGGARGYMAGLAGAGHRQG
mmetsp:Transcript_3676/g.16871  ORF Transcript_3676/g.16871 Transcript_3676/m.16871 type:complete len:315 (+) Transcript_3676:816-1760(+)